MFSRIRTINALDILLFFPASTYLPVLFSFTSYDADMASRRGGE